jgi:hypothetical protein
MKVADLMRTDLKTIPASATVADAIAALLQTGSQPCQWLTKRNGQSESSATRTF